MADDMTMTRRNISLKTFPKAVFSSLWQLLYQNVSQVVFYDKSQTV
jgi:hypothetical protein